MLRKVVMLMIFVLYGSTLGAADESHQSGPFFNPSTKSYFQLFTDNENPGVWQAARKRAATKVYKGVRGRLAVIDSMETHKFILQSFGLNWREASVWIGLRYWCSARMLQWETGLPYSPSDATHFRMWHTKWARADGEACGMEASKRSGFAPVYYRNIGGTVRWQAVGAGKGFNAYLVEFVTDGE
jgi:hypothetical protein